MRTVRLTAGDQVTIMQMLPATGTVTEIQLTKGLSDVLNNLPAQDVELEEEHYMFVRGLLQKAVGSNAVSIQHLELLDIFPVDKE